METTRRGFLRQAIGATAGLVVGGVVVGEAVRQWPYRVYSFPSEVKIKAFDYPSELQFYAGRSGSLGPWVWKGRIGQVGTLFCFDVKGEYKVLDPVVMPGSASSNFKLDEALVTLR